MGHMKTALIGDVAGHEEALLDALDGLGVDIEARRMPPDLHVVQVGDLVDRGPRSDAVIALVDGMMRVNPGRWIQLAGNHEAQYLGGPRFWRESLNEDSQETIRQWQETERIWASVVVRTSHRTELLVSHAGVTSEFWREHLGGADDPVTVADQLNQMLRASSEMIFSAGCALSDGGRSTPAPDKASPLWADATRELYPGWVTGPRVPWGQVHGHSTPYDWVGRKWKRSDVPWERLGTIDAERRHVSLEISGLPFHAIDPDLRASDVAVPVAPLVLDGGLIGP